MQHLNMQHLNEEQLVEHYYHDDANPLAAEQHLRECAECRTQYASLNRILSLVTNAEVPDRGEDYGTEVWNRLRWKLGRDRRKQGWQTFVAIAAALVLVFLAGRYWSHIADVPANSTAQVASNGAAGTPAQIATSITGTPAHSGAAAAHETPNPGAQERLLLVVVSDHLDVSERMLLEVANADVKKGLGDNAALRAEELVASNRIYRQTAARRGDARVASVLSDIEPILVELANAGPSLTQEQLEKLQKRIETKGLLFKVRVISAQVEDAERPAAGQTRTNNTNSL
jgi:hypothetical protein